MARLGQLAKAWYQSMLFKSLAEPRYRGEVSTRRVASVREGLLPEEHNCK
jgi:hypothetical protein